MDGERSALANVSLSKYDYPLMEQNISVAQTSFRTSVICVGILLNCVVHFVVTFSRQLHYPRHIFWAAISIFECLFLVDNAFELVTVHKRDHLACQFVVLFYPVDYSILLICMSLAALDRYLSIVRYEWYQANVTNRGVILLITIAVGLTFVILTSPFWTGYKSLFTCTASMIHILWVFTWNLFLGIVCVIVHFKIFTETKILIRQYVPKYRRAPLTVKFVSKSSFRQPSNISSDHRLASKSTGEQVLMTISEYSSGVRRENLTLLSQDHEMMLPSVFHHQVDTDDSDRHSHLPSQSTLNKQDGPGCFPLVPVRSKISRLEVQAALNLSVHILPFWLCTFPVACYAIVVYWCIRLDSNCKTIVVTWNYFWDTFMLHSVYNPIVYMATCSEFRRAVLHIAKKLSDKFDFV